MIQIFAKEGRQGPTVMLGLLPENVKRIREGKPLIARFREISPELPDYTLSIAVDAHLSPTAETCRENHISVNMHGDALERFLRRKLWEIPLSANPKVNAGALTLVLFYTDNEESFIADLLAQGVSIKEFRDDREVAS